ncbi:DMT family transporter [Ectothiorhodospiraceae bacterium WFHF3C12]|nr:DMT family transporter [Ectothiorhodospiraceae bacterium WFHF3C12]
MTLLALGNLCAILSDTLIKWHGEGQPVFQFILIRLVFATALLAPLIPASNVDWIFRLSWLHALRAHISVAGIFCMFIALTHLPLATANALFYAAPVMVMLLAVTSLGERTTRFSVLTVLSGFTGILLILRPLDFSWYGISGLGAAAALSCNAVLVKKIPKKQSTAQSLFLMHFYAVPTALILMLIEDADWHWEILYPAMASSVLIVGYNATVLFAYMEVSANKITSAEYTGLIWAAGLGWLWFQEVPGAWFFSGSVLIIGPIVLLSISEHRTAALDDRLARKQVPQSSKNRDYYPGSINDLGAGEASQDA